jgi:hypothetical protein
MIIQYTVMFNVMQPGIIASNRIDKKVFGEALCTSFSEHFYACIPFRLYFHFGIQLCGSLFYEYQNIFSHSFGNGDVKWVLYQIRFI